MKVLIATLVLFAIALKFSRQIHKFQIGTYVVITVVSIVAYLLKDIEGIIVSGELATAFIMVVIFQSVFKKGSKMSTNLLIVRKEYSILAFISIIPHFLIYIIGEYQNLEINGIIAFVIMVPLFITSFTKIRKKLSTKNWKNLHIASYIVYILLFIHLILMSEGVNRIIYIILLATYIIAKSFTTRFYKIDTKLKKILILLAIIIVIILNIVRLNKINQMKLESTQQVNEITKEETKLKDGTYEGSAAGFHHMDVAVSVTIENDEIKDIIINSYGATNARHGMDYKQAVDTVKQNILDNQTTSVDAISGATYSTTGLKNAVENAMNKAIE